MDDPAPVADLFSDIEYVGGEKDRPAFAGVAPEEVLHLPLHDGVEVYQRFIDEDEAGFVEESLSEHQLLSGAPGEILAENIAFILKLQQIKPVVAPRIDPIETSDAGNKVEVLLGGEETWRRLLLGDDPDELPDPYGVLHHVKTHHPGRPGRRSDLPGQHPDHRRLARTVRPEQAEELSPDDGERYPVHGGDGAVLFCEGLCLDHLMHPGHTPPISGERTSAATTYNTFSFLPGR